MLEISEKLSHHHETMTELSVALSYDARKKSRIRVALSNGEEAAIFMPRGSILRGGDILVASDGRKITVIAADQAVSKVTAKTAQALTRAAYHLGNRHVPLQIEASWLIFERDAVLKDMLLGLGDIEVEDLDAPFEPEAGAYGGGHHHGHDH